MSSNELEFRYTNASALCAADRAEIDTVWTEAFGKSGAWAGWSKLCDFGVAFARHAHGRVVAVCLTSDQDMDTARASCHVFCLGAHPKRHGYGSRLMDCIKHVCAGRYTSVTLRVNVRDLETQVFYARQGFCVTAAPTPSEPDVGMTFPVARPAGEPCSPPPPAARPAARAVVYTNGWIGRICLLCCPRPPPPPPT